MLTRAPSSLPRKSQTLAYDTPENKGEVDAKTQSIVHADTPTRTLLDRLGRPFVTIAHNGLDGLDGLDPILFKTHVKLDIEGNPRVVTDANLIAVVTRLASIRKWLALASDDASLLSFRPVETVSRAGGHGTAEATLIERTGNLDTSQNVGFVMIWEGDGAISLRWNSTTINDRNFGDRAAPFERREEIINAIEQTTGFRVNR